MGKKIDYLKRVLQHKYYVYKAGVILGVPRHRLILHDWTKFLPVEFLPYAKYNFGGENSRKVQYDFDKAWLHHQNRNDHHWQYWILFYDENEGNHICMEMPKVCVKEMIADWMGASKAYTGSWDMTNWLEKNLNKLIISEQTERDIIHTLFHELDYDLATLRSYRNIGLKEIKVENHTKEPFCCDGNCRA